MKGLLVFFTMMIVMVAGVLYIFHNISYHKDETLVVVDTLKNGDPVLRSLKTGLLETSKRSVTPFDTIGDTVDVYLSDASIIGVHTSKMKSRNPNR